MKEEIKVDVTTTASVTRFFQILDSQATVISRSSAKHDFDLGIDLSVATTTSAYSFSVVLPPGETHEKPVYPAAVPYKTSHHKK